MTFRIVPKLDIKNNFLVKGINMEGLEKIGNPLAIAEEYYNEGADEIIIQDCVASLYKKNNLEDIVENFSKKIFIPLTIGGGIRSLDNVFEILNKGADRVSVNSYLFENKNFINQVVNVFGSTTICTNIETQFIDGKFFVYKDFGRNNTNFELTDWIKFLQDCGIGEIIITSIRKEGTQSGFDMVLLEKIYKEIKVPLLIHGGAGCREHILDISKIEIVSGVVLSSVLHNCKKINKNKDENKFNYDPGNCLNISDLKNFLKKNHIQINSS